VLPAPPSSATKRPGRASARDAGDDVAAPGHPVERGVREDGVEGGVVAERLRVGGLEGERRVSRARRRHHLVRGVEPDDARSARRDHRRELAGSAADVEHALPRARREQLDQLVPRVRDERGALVVETRIPAVQRIRHSA
jgi:hypothetical protein